MKTIKVQLTEQEIQALQTPLYVEHENAKLMMRQACARATQVPDVLEHLQARIDAIDKLREALVS